MDSDAGTTTATPYTYWNEHSSAAGPLGSDDQYYQHYPSHQLQTVIYHAPSCAREMTAASQQETYWRDQPQHPHQMHYSVQRWPSMANEFTSSPTEEQRVQLHSQHMQQPRALPVPIDSVHESYHVPIQHHTQQSFDHHDTNSPATMVLPSVPYQSYLSGTSPNDAELADPTRDSAVEADFQPQHSSPTESQAMYSPWDASPTASSEARHVSSLEHGGHYTSNPNFNFRSDSRDSTLYPGHFADKEYSAYTQSVGVSNGDHALRQFQGRESDAYANAPAHTFMLDHDHYHEHQQQVVYQQHQHYASQQREPQWTTGGVPSNTYEDLTTSGHVQQQHHQQQHSPTETRAVEYLKVEEQECTLPQDVTTSDSYDTNSHTRVSPVGVVYGRTPTCATGVGTGANSSANTIPTPQSPHSALPLLPPPHATTSQEQHHNARMPSVVPSQLQPLLPPYVTSGTTRQQQQLPTPTTPSQSPVMISGGPGTNNVPPNGWMVKKDPDALHSGAGGPTISASSPTSASLSNALPESSTSSKAQVPLRKSTYPHPSSLSRAPTLAQNFLPPVHGGAKPSTSSPMEASANRNGSSSQQERDKKPVARTAGREKQPHVACNFCRRRKIACVPGPSGDKDVGPCMPCAKRDLVCVKPESNRRGNRKRGNSSGDEASAGNPNPTLSSSSGSQSLQQQRQPPRHGEDGSSSPSSSPREEVPPPPETPPRLTSSSPHGVPQQPPISFGT